MSDTANRGGARARPVFEPKIVSTVPDDITLPRSGSRPDPKLMQGIQLAVAHPGETIELGLWFSESGAHNQFKKFDKGKVKLPAGDWDLDPRRMWAEEEDGSPVIDEKTGRQKRWSKLYATYNGPVANDS